MHSTFRQRGHVSYTMIDCHGSSCTIAAVLLITSFAVHALRLCCATWCLRTVRTTRCPGGSHWCRTRRARWGWATWVLRAWPAAQARCSSPQQQQARLPHAACLPGHGHHQCCAASRSGYKGLH
ncbi:hypothetical protein COO60DRAFT_1101995 [Scenedesmus sp. NREL 46B-D3]|nr:hypothetical protein COO60DRAFT_1101995 [Scenedesmus sp. NREL 46B-D3]